MKKIMCFIFGCIVLMVAVGYAENKTTLLPIKPVPAIDKGDKTEKYTIEHGISEVQASGMISRISENEIVINNALYRLAPDVVFYNEDHERIAKKEFRKGNVVGWRVNSKGAISKLWKLANAPEG